MHLIETYYDNFLTSEFSKHQDITPEIFAEVLNSLISNFTENQEFHQILKSEDNQALNNFITSLNISELDKINLAEDCYIFSFFLIYCADFFIKENASKIFLAYDEIHLFKEVSFPRIVELKNNLVTKHPILEKVLTEHFNNLELNLLNDLDILSKYLAPFSNLAFEDIEVKSTLFQKNNGRPSSLMIDLVLLNLSEVANEIFPTQPFAKFIMPMIRLLSERYPQIISESEFADYEKLRKRIKYIKKKDIIAKTGE